MIFCLIRTYNVSSIPSRDTSRAHLTGIQIGRYFKIGSLELYSKLTKKKFYLIKNFIIGYIKYFSPLLSNV